MRTLYLHIGTPKTATTAIQQFCRQNRDVLREKGYDYPLFKFRYFRGSSLRNGHFLADICRDSEGKRDKEMEERRYQKAAEKIKTLFQNSQGVILSDEGIWNEVRHNRNTHWKKLRELGDANGIQVKVIVYLRSQDDLLVSWWKQQIEENRKIPAAMKPWDPKALSKRLALNYEKNLHRVARIYGEENIIVRIFHPSCFEGSNHTIQSDFLHVLGLELDESFRMPEEKQNLSLRGNLPEIKRLINNLPDFDEVSAPAARQAAKEASVCSSEYKYSMFSPEEKKAFMDSFAESNAVVAEKYLGRTDGRLFPESSPDLPKWTPDNPYMYADIVRYFGEAHLRQVKQIREMESRLDAQQDEIRALQEVIRGQQEAQKKQQRGELYRMARKVKHRLTDPKK